MKTKLKKADWDALSLHFNQPDFIPSDPISFPHRYMNCDDWRNVECIAFVSSLFSYGRRDKIIETLTSIFSKLGPEPVQTLQDTRPDKLKKQFQDFYYRFNTAEDLTFLLNRLAGIYRQDGSLKQHWATTHQETGDLKHSIHEFRNWLLQEGEQSPPATYGMKFLFADPLQNSAAKRFNMFLRWMVRKDAVDLGIWADITSPRDLIIPLDTHVAAMARQYQITERKSNDWRTAEEITAFFRKLCPEDPIRYDFALFGLGLNGGNVETTLDRLSSTAGVSR